MNGWVRWHRVSCHRKDPSWIIRYIQSQFYGPRTKPQALQRERHRRVCFSVSSRWDVVLTTNMTPPRGDWMCTRAYGVQHAGRVASPLAKRCWVYSLPSERMQMMDSEASLFHPGFVWRRQLKAKNKRPGRDDPASCSVLSNNGRTCLFSFWIN